MNKLNRGYYGIGIYHVKTGFNIGTLWRSAYIYGADFIFTIGKRYKKQASDTLCTYRHVPLWHFTNFRDFKDHIPYSAQIICVEIADGTESLATFKHPEQAIYLLGAEDDGLPEDILKGRKKVCIPSVRSYCLNVAVAGSIIMYDRFVKRNKED